MAAPKSRLGRGLESLISGGFRPAEASPAPETAKKAAHAKAPARKSAPKKKTAGKKAPASKPPAVKKAPAPAPTPPPEPPQDEWIREGLAEIPLAKIEPNPHQPRKSFHDESLRELAESIRSEGLL